MRVGDEPAHSLRTKDSMNQRGIAWIPMLLSAVPYLVGGILLYGAYQWVDNNWVTDAGIAEGRKRAEDELQPLLTACEGRVKALGSQIETQNAAVAALEAAGKAKVARATQGMQVARSVAQTAQAEAARLREAALAPLGSECPAGEAVLKIRQGLKP